MLFFLSWYLLITLTGWIAFPLAFRFLPYLSDRGYAFSRSLGLLLWGFIFWLLTSLGILRNDIGGILGGLLLVLVLAGISLRGRTGDLRVWLRQNWKMILWVEVLFLAFFGAWAVVRAANPEITGTEKPMELAFINAILRSPTFPPHDPWLAGYSISYYYFGYVLVAMLARLTGTSGGVAFNLAISLWFALTALGGYGVLYSLLGWRFTARQGSRPAPLGVVRVFAGLAPLFILLVSNLEGLLEKLHARGLFWSQAADGSWQSSFWKWLDIQELVNAPAQPFTWIPNRSGGIWWWRASRVLQDYSLNGQPKEIIDEFPFFSYLLSDLHPHVLAMPFALLSVGLAFNFYLAARRNPLTGPGLLTWVGQWMQNAAPPFAATRLGILLRRADFWIAAVVLGGMAFLNTWDFPIYVGLFAAAYSLARYQEEGWSIHRVYELVELAVVLILFGVLLYLPFYFGFSSQAGGILPSLSFFTRGVHLWVMFGSLLIPIFAWLVYIWRWRGGLSLLKKGLGFSALLVFGFWLVSFLLAWIVLIVLGGAERFAPLRDLFYGLHGSPSAFRLIAGSIVRRLAQPGAWITLLVLIALVWGLFASYRPKDRSLSLDDEPGPARPLAGAAAANSFVLLLILLGAGLVLVPEFFYLRDQFGWRMNTIFKFYFQAWMVWALAAAYGSAVLLNEIRSQGWRIAWAAVFLVLMSASLIYPLYGVWDRANKFQPEEWTLDGTAYLQRYQPDEMEAIEWLAQAPAGIVSEAVGGSYSGYARVATISGQPNVLGWPGHESQWRGGAEEMGSRETDIQRLYRTNDWQDALQIIQKYQIRYIYVGALERSTYRVSESKFQANLEPVFSNNSVIIYQVPELDLQVESTGP